MGVELTRSTDERNAEGTHGNHAMKYGCAILAGGRGSRMGEVNKAELAYQGRAFIDLIAEELEQLELPCYLSSANYAQKNRHGWIHVPDDITDENGEYIGPMGGIFSCLRRAEADGLDGLFFVPCDAPLFTSAEMSILGAHIEKGVDAVIWQTADGRLQPTFGYFGTSCLPKIRDFIERKNYKLRMLLGEINCRILRADEYAVPEKCFRNVNKIEDYEALIPEL